MERENQGPSMGGKGQKKVRERSLSRRDHHRLGKVGGQKWNDIFDTFQRLLKQYLSLLVEGHGT